MTRHVGAVAIALCVISQPLAAQSVVFTVKTASATVHKAPSTGSPVIGTAPQGAKLEVTRELGSWVKVVWPRGEDGVGYVHVTTGAIAGGAVPARDARAASPARPAVASPPPPAAAPASRSAAADAQAPARSTYVRTPAHSLGVGGRMEEGGQFGFGASARAWSRQRLGVQLAISRAGIADAPEPVTSTWVEASVIYALPDRVIDSWWVRPYVGAGPGLQHQTLAIGTGSAPDSASDTRFGFEAFGGGEVTFAGLPQLALSVDVGHRWISTPFAGAEASGMQVSVSAHWYIK